MNRARINKAMILAAGFGTRLKPLTDTLPKALVPVNGKPMTVHVVDKLIDAGVTEIVINVHHFSELMEDFFRKNRFAAEIHLCKENEILGTGGGIKNAKEFLSGPGDFIVHNVDVESDIDLNEMMNFHFNNSAFATLAVQNRKTSRPLLFNSRKKLCGRIVEGKISYCADEQTELDEYAFNGIHIISSGIFDEFPPENEFDIIPVYLALAGKGKSIMGYDTGKANWRDLGKFESPVK